MKKLLFLVNPFSGKGLISQHILEICDIFTKGGYEVTVRPTQSNTDVYEYITENESKYDLIVCSGGDGTLNQSIKAYMTINCQKPLGYIPAGTMNDFASTLGIPKDMPAAARIVIDEFPVAVDVGRFNEEYFTYIAAFGAFTAVSYATDQQLKNNLGILAYFAEAVRTADMEKSCHMLIRYDDVTIEDDFIFGMIANSMSVGGIKGLAGNDVWLDDGIFEGLMVKKPKNLSEIQQTFNTLLKRDFSSPYLYYFKSGHFEIETTEPVPWTLDGEFGGSHTSVEINNCHCAVKIFSGKNSVIGESK